MANYRNREEEPKQAKKPARRSSKKKVIFKRILLVLLVLFIIGTVAVGATVYSIVKDVPKIDAKLLSDPVSSKIYDKNGIKIADIGSEKRVLITYKGIPKNLEHAVLASEDARFYKHHGIDVKRTIGAIVANFTGGFGSQGGSTITQQVVKLSFLTRDKTIERKIKEWYLAYNLEKKYSKEQILEIYLNKIFLGGNIYGVGAASEYYFGKPVGKLTIAESALLTGIIPSPNNYNPRVDPVAAKNRRDTVLDAMYKNKFITKSELNEAKDIKIEDMLSKEKKGTATPYQAFINQVVQEVSSLNKDINVYADGLKIYTTIDTKLQDHANKILEGKSNVKFPNDNLQVGFVLLDSKTGEVRAIGNGRDRKPTDFNFATDIRNQPGSTIKPILDYGPAIEYLKLSTGQGFKDEEYHYSDKDKTPINNFDGKYKGDMTMRDALAQSRNIPALKAFQKVGAKKAGEFAKSLGIQFKEGPYEAYSIGGFNGVSPLQLAGAYSAFANEGKYSKPHIVTKIVTQDEESYTVAPKEKRVMSVQTSYMITDMLRSVMTSGTGVGGNIPGLDIAGKTGSTNFDTEMMDKYGMNKHNSYLARDVWFAGYTPEYTIAVWSGYEKFTADDYINTSGEYRIAKDVFKDFMSYATRDIKNTRFKQPSGIVRATVEKGSDPPMKPSEFTPKDQIASEWFFPGTTPTKVSDKYKQTEPVKNLKVKLNSDNKTAAVTWEYPKDPLKDKEKDKNQKDSVILFEISISLDEGPFKVVGTTDKLNFTLKNLQAGGSYKISVKAFPKDNEKNKSKEVVVPLLVPDSGILPPVDGGGTDNGNPDNNGNPGDNGNSENNGNSGGEGILPPITP